MMSYNEKRSLRRMLEYDFDTHEEMTDVFAIAGESLSMTLEKIRQLYLKTNNSCPMCRESNILQQLENPTKRRRI